LLGKIFFIKKKQKANPLPKQRKIFKRVYKNVRNNIKVKDIKNIFESCYSHFFQKAAEKRRKLKVFFMKRNKKNSRSSIFTGDANFLFRKRNKKTFHCPILKKFITS